MDAFADVVERQLHARNGGVELGAGYRRYAVAYLLWVNLLVFAGALTALALVRRAAHRPAARALAVFVALLCLSEIPAFLSQFQLHRSLFPGLMVVAQLLAAVAFFRFTAVFLEELGSADRLSLGIPGGAVADRFRHSVLPWLLAGLVAVLVLSFPLSPYPYGALLAIPLGYSLVLLFIMLGIRALRVGFGSANPEDRGRILWIVNGFVAAFWAAIFLTVFPGLLYGAYEGYIGAGRDVSSELVFQVYDDVGSLIPISVILLSVITGVFYHGAVDPALALRKTTVYGAMAIAAVFLFAGLESLVSELLEEGLGVSGLVGSIVVGGAVALAIAPLYGKLRAVAERFLPRYSRPETPNKP